MRQFIFEQSVCKSSGQGTHDNDTHTPETCPEKNVHGPGTCPGQCPSEPEENAPQKITGDTFVLIRNPDDLPFRIFHLFAFVNLYAHNPGTYGYHDNTVHVKGLKVEHF